MQLIFFQGYYIHDLYEELKVNEHALSQQVWKLTTSDTDFKLISRFLKTLLVTDFWTASEASTAL